MQLGRSAGFLNELKLSVWYWYCFVCSIAAINQLPPLAGEAFHGLLWDRMSATIVSLKKQALLQRQRPQSPWAKETLVVIPFCTRPWRHLPLTKSFQENIRELYLQATFWSVHRYFDHVVVGVASSYDLSKVQSMQLPLFEVYDFREWFNQTDGKTKQQRSLVQLPKMTLLRAIENLSNDSRANFSYTGFKHVYFTESDQILQMRCPDLLFSSIERSDSKLVLAPHRMQVCQSLRKWLGRRSLGILSLACLPDLKCFVYILDPETFALRSRVIV
jgi:hypothetical protein